MRVLDIFSMVLAKELSTEQIEDIFIKSFDGVKNDTYVVVHELPDNAESNIIECTNDLLKEGKQVAYLMKNDLVVSIVGYKK
ncbi:MAG: hypothetical protein IJZ42_00300 [Lachnospiraceae bacterium]|nr:hypothetical protein [Lachnospiraceae bacterium]